MNAKILIVDDDPVVRHLLGSVLRAAGHEVDIATNGAECLAKLNAAPDGAPDVVFLDLQLPDMTGADLLERIRALGGAVRPSVAMLTANSEAETRRLFPGLAPEYFLEKPFPPQRANEVVRDLMSKRTA